MLNALVIYFWFSCSHCNKLIKVPLLIFCFFESIFDDLIDHAYIIDIYCLSHNFLFNESEKLCLILLYSINTFSEQFFGLKFTIFSCATLKYFFLPVKYTA